MLAERTARAKETKDERRRLAVEARRKAMEAKRLQDDIDANRERELAIRKKLEQEAEKIKNQDVLALVQAGRDREEARRQEAVRLGLDRINLSSRQLDHVPADLWTVPGAKKALEHVQVIDLSCNQLSRLPEH